VEWNLKPHLRSTEQVAGTKSTLTTEGLTMDFDTVAPNAGAPRRVLVPESTFRRENLRVVLGYPYNHRVRPHTEPVP
jgi:hypothetical protein